MALVYFFHRFAETLQPDLDGVDLPNDGAAIALAMRKSRSAAEQAAQRGKLDLRHRVEIVDANKRLVRAITFADAFRA